MTAPWTATQVSKLNRLQADPRFHGYTCPGPVDEPGCTEQSKLRATEHGWVCACGLYRQLWAHDIEGG